MKKFLGALALTLALVVGVFGTAGAESGLVPRPLQFRVSANNADGYVLRGNSVRTSRTIDTTQAIPVSDIGIPQRSGATAADSVTVGFLFYWPTASGATADSAEVGMEVSIDGVNWQAATPNILYNASFASAVSGAATINGAIVQERGTTNSFFRRLQIQVGAQSLFLASPVQNATTAPTELTWGSFRFIRFLIGSDATGTYAASLSHFKNTDR